jgi:adenylate cyclase
MACSFFPPPTVPAGKDRETMSGKTFNEDTEMKEFKRRLAILLSAEPAGCEGPTSENEALTTMPYMELAQAVIEKRRGRIVGSPEGDLFAEFSGVTDAVQTALAVQKELQARNDELSEERRVKLRIGIDLGDILEEEDGVYGRGAKIAAGLARMGDPGGVCISKSVYEQVESKLPLGYEYLGEKTFENVYGSVGVYRVSMKPRIVKAGGIEKDSGLSWRRKVFYFLMVPILVVDVFAGFLRLYPELLLRGKTVFSGGSTGLASAAPTIAVLPFENLSGDPGQAYFSDGITEDIITALSIIPRLQVIARNSTFAYKEKSVDVKQVGRELGARYILEGSIQKADDRVRITAQLIEAATGYHLWAERFDRDVKNLFDLQDEIALHIASALQVKLVGGSHVTKKPPKNLDAYLKLLRGGTNSCGLPWKTTPGPDNFSRKPSGSTRNMRRHTPPWPVHTFGSIGSDGAGTPRIPFREPGTWWKRPFPLIRPMPVPMRFQAISSC